jgi:hypothetical protein
VLSLANVPSQQFDLQLSSALVCLAQMFGVEHCPTFVPARWVRLIKLYPQKSRALINSTEGFLKFLEDTSEASAVRLFDATSTSSPVSEAASLQFGSLTKT